MKCPYCNAEADGDKCPKCRAAIPAKNEKKNTKQETENIFKEEN